MNQLNSINRDQDNIRFFADRLPDLLGELSYAEENNCLRVVYNSTVFYIHFNEGQLVYATNSVAPFERLERHLRRLSNQNNQITNSIIKLPRQKFTNDLQSYTSFPTDYQSIMWLLKADHVTENEAITLIRRITREVFESFLCLPNLQKYKIIPRSNKIEEVCRFELNAYTEQCRKRLKSWEAFADHIWSSYQRPYLVNAKGYQIDNLSVQQNATISKLLKGLNFRQISAVIDRDELVVAKILYPSIRDNTIVIRDPKPPFDLLPNLPQQKNLFELPADPDWRGEDSGFLKVNSHSKQTVIALENTWKVAYVDNDVAAQESLGKYLEQNLFCVLAITDAMNAFAELIEFQPSIIFLRADMPEINGYELCALLRNHHDLRSVPIIMVGESSRRIDEAKSKRAGATKNIVKPFDRTKLLTTIWQYLQ
ncbi:MAG: response regulator [Cyanobacteria bacterium J06631_6]